MLRDQKSVLDFFVAAQPVVIQAFVRKRNKKTVLFGVKTGMLECKISLSTINSLLSWPPLAAEQAV